MAELRNGVVLSNNRPEPWLEAQPSTCCNRAVPAPAARAAGDTAIPRTQTDSSFTTAATVPITAQSHPNRPFPHPCENLLGPGSGCGEAALRVKSLELHERFMQHRCNCRRIFRPRATNLKVGCRYHARAAVVRCLHDSSSGRRRPSPLHPLVKLLQCQLTL
jgi:hypothetical protein